MPQPRQNQVPGTPWEALPRPQVHSLLTFKALGFTGSLPIKHQRAWWQEGGSRSQHCSLPHLLFLVLLLAFGIRAGKQDHRQAPGGQIPSSFSPHFWPSKTLSDRSPHSFDRAGTHRCTLLMVFPDVSFAPFTAKDALPACEAGSSVMAAHLFPSFSNQHPSPGATAAPPWS